MISNKTILISYKTILISYKTILISYKTMLISYKNQVDTALNKTGDHKQACYRELVTQLPLRGNKVTELR